MSLSPCLKALREARNLSGRSALLLLEVFDGEVDWKELGSAPGLGAVLEEVWKRKRRAFPREAILANPKAPLRLAWSLFEEGDPEDRVREGGLLALNSSLGERELEALWRIAWRNLRHPGASELVSRLLLHPNLPVSIAQEAYRTGASWREASPPLGYAIVRARVPWERFVRHLSRGGFARLRPSLADGLRQRSMEREEALWLEKSLEDWGAVEVLWGVRANPAYPPERVLGRAGWVLHPGVPVEALEEVLWAPHAPQALQALVLRNPGLPFSLLAEALKEFAPGGRRPSAFLFREAERALRERLEGGPSLEEARSLLRLKREPFLLHPDLTAEEALKVVEVGNLCDLLYLLLNPGIDPRKLPAHLLLEGASRAGEEEGVLVKLYALRAGLHLADGMRMGEVLPFVQGRVAEEVLGL